MILDISNKSGKIYVKIELTQYGRENQKKQKYYRSSVEQMVIDRGLRPGACLKNSVIHNLDDKALKGEWIFEDLEYVPKKKVAQETPLVVSSEQFEALAELASMPQEPTPSLKKIFKKKSEESK